ncbi:hypothetical protein QCD85_12280 [Paenibacillus sp. PsM32]|uniref:integrin alpha n=1 Tax=unclassified Paenibacillus TaxID=185978 RepID=UPI00263B3E0C|nr:MULTISPECIES: hypothetical protein [unclassified Paenibacillus]MDN4618881.1 hypothetical protein [Paenibacillus sp. PsM32]MDQ1235210.1 hypothetical protein [Paenibacillus sp. SORGH_AS_0306]
MGFFKRNKKEQDHMEQADQAMNKGLSGLIMKSIVPKEQRDQINASLEMARQAQSSASGQIPITATAQVISVKDTGKLVNFDPIIILVLDVTENNGTRYQKTLETMVSKMHIPRPGDHIGLGIHPSSPANFIYMGIISSS